MSLHRAPQCILWSFAGLVGLPHALACVLVVIFCTKHCACSLTKSCGHFSPPESFWKSLKPSAPTFPLRAHSTCHTSTPKETEALCNAEHPNALGVCRGRCQVHQNNGTRIWKELAPLGQLFKVFILCANFPSIRGVTDAYIFSFQQAPVLKII